MSPNVTKCHQHFFFGPHAKNVTPPEKFLRRLGPTGKLADHQPPTPGDPLPIKPNQAKSRCVPFVTLEQCNHSTM
jgi:hypothetical protein